MVAELPGQDGGGQRFALLFEHMLEGCAYCRMVYDAAGRPDDFVCLAVNPAFGRLTGLNDVVGRRVSDVIPGVKQETPELFELCGGVVESGDPAELELDFTPLDRQLHLSVFRPEPGHFVAVFADETEQRRLRRELDAERLRLAASGELYRSILKASPDDITVTDLEGRILLVSPAAVSLLGHEREEDIVGRSMLEYLAPEDRERAQANVALMFEGIYTGPGEYLAVRADGTRLPIEVNGDFTRDAEGRPTGMVFVVRDITERRRAEDEIRRLNAELHARVTTRTAQLETTNKELEAFAYSVSHDLRAPLRAIDGFSAMLAEDAGGKLTQEDLDHLQRVRHAAQRMAALLDDLLGLSRTSRRDLRRVEVDLSALATSLLDELRQAHPGRSVECVVAPHLTARADRELVRVILSSLISNAWKFTGRRDAARIEVGAFENGGERVFFVRDNGAGFDMSYAEHLFGAFQRMHSAEEFEGNGIGLATVQRLVTMHGGRVWAEAAVDEGATLYFTIPDGVD